MFYQSSFPSDGFSGSEFKLWGYCQNTFYVYCRHNQLSMPVFFLLSYNSEIIENEKPGKLILRCDNKDLVPGILPTSVSSLKLAPRAYFGVCVV